MVTVETKVQLALKEFLIEEINKYLKTKKNFDVVLSIASLINPYEEEPDPCEPYKEICDRAGMCIACYDGYIHPMDWRADYNLNFYSPFKDLTLHEKEYLKCAWNKEVHTCTEGCSKFICFKYTGETCAVEQCFNLFVKTRKNMKYCSVCRHAKGIIFHDHHLPLEEWDCYCKRFLPELFYGKYSEVRLHDHWKAVKDWSCYCKHGSYFFNDEAKIKYYKSIGDPWFADVKI